jgi:uncharacterized coiled-coil protein SlyX
MNAMNIKLQHRIQELEIASSSQVDALSNKVMGLEYQVQQLRDMIQPMTTGRNEQSYYTEDDGQNVKVLSQPLVVNSTGSGYNIDENLDVNQCVELCLMTDNLSFIDETLGNRDLFREITPANI